MSPQRLKNLCFPFLLLGAVGCAGLYLLSPQTVRNLQLEQQVYQQQWELIDLESRNQERLLLLQKKQQQPELLTQNDPSATAGSTQLITVPQSLAIAPDQLWQSEIISQTNAAERTYLAQRWGLPFAFWRKIAEPGFWRSGLLGGSILLGLLSWLSVLSAPSLLLSAATGHLARLLENRYRPRTDSSTD